MSKITGEQTAFDALMRDNFRFFVARVFKTLNEGREYHPNWHIDLICDMLADCAKGRNKRLIINMPPRSLKSICTSVALPAWLMGRDPTKRVMCISYGEDLADKHAADCLKVMGTDWYKAAFPETRLLSSKPAVSDFSLTRGGGRLSVSVGGAITGRGADFIIIDDPLKADAANFDTALKKVNQWYDQNVYQRLDSKKDGVIIVVMQRLHKNDLTGHLLIGSAFFHLALPAIAQENEEHEIYDGICVTRQKGEALHEEHEPLEQLAEVRKQIGEHTFAAQYQQAPASAEGGIVKAEWLPRYDSSKINSKTEFDYIFQSWDTALTAKDTSDYSVCITVGYLNSKIYILDVYREKIGVSDLILAARSKAKEYQTERIFIEDTAAGPRLIKALNDDANLIEVIAVKPLGDKEARLKRHTTKFEQGEVLLPQAAHWLESFLRELTKFPGAKHDDQVDALTQALDHLVMQPPSVELPFLFPGDDGPGGSGDSFIEDGMIWTRRE